MREQRPFKLTTDPHQCAFGRWYDTFTTQNSQLAFQLRKSQAPHNQIHAVGADVVQMGARSTWSDALRLIEDTGRSVLSGLQRIFQEVRQTLREAHDEVAVVVEAWGRPFAVDAVEGVEAMARTKPLAASEVATEIPSVSTVGISARDNRFVMILLTDRLLQVAVEVGT